MQYQYGSYSLQAQNMGVPNAKYKTMLCRHYEATKLCSVGSKCQFAHGPQELRSMNDPLPASAMSAMSQALQQPTQQHNYKSVLCKYQQNGFCKNGNNCTFIHEDPEQLQQQNQQMYSQQQQYYGNPYQNVQYPPAMSTAAYIDQSVLLYLLREMEKEFSHREVLVPMIKKAYADVERGVIQSGADTVKYIIHESQITAEEREKYQKIYDNSRLYYLQLQQQQYFPQQPIP